MPASRTKAGHVSPRTPTINPARPAPTTPAMTRVAWVIALAASRPSAGTTRGTSAPRAGVKNVPMDACTNASASSAGSMAAESMTTNPSTTTARRLSETSMIRRRSQRSAYVPGDEPDRQRRDGQGDRDRGEGHRGARQLVDEQHQGQHRQAVADVGDALGGPQAPEVGEPQDVARAERDRRAGLSHPRPPRDRHRAARRSSGRSRARSRRARPRCPRVRRRSCREAP